ncbi:NAD-binding protein [Rickenella mellea]|uniref:Probable quinone oxidoreductase n=1 Tax=Rickenella mellea TaxID=50990 RepID=A0A4Y7Q0N3_9AGAM|nr:NAD-binding protein [Rickenella mellea]
MSLPSTIKAVVAPKYGDIDVMELTTLPFPQPAPNEVLIKVLYAGVNFIDTYQRAGIYPAKAFPVRLGMEGAGVLVKAPTDAAVRGDAEYKKRGFTDGAHVVFRQPGAFSEYVTAPWDKVHVLPPSISPLTGAASFLQGLTAVTFLTESYAVQRGDTILIHTIAGGLGLLLLQIAKARGVTVIGTTSTKEKAELAKGHGADYVILYKVENTAERVLEITNGEGVHAVFDGVGKDTFDDNFKLVRRKGTIVSFGNASGVVPPFPLLKLTEKNVKILRPTVINYVATPAESERYANELFQLIEKGTTKINVHKAYPFSGEGVQQAQRDLTGGHTTGKLVVHVADE